jgi:hypothetical protein
MPLCVLQGGQLVYEATGLPADCCPIAMTGDGRVVLAATSTGSIISLGWPQHPEPPAAAAQFDEEDLDFDGLGLSFSGAARSPGAPQAVGGRLGSGPGFKNLSVQVGSAAAGASPRNHSGKSTPRVQLQGAGGVHSPGQAQAAQAAQGQSSTPAAPKAGHRGADCGASGSGRHEYQLHATRITAIKILHHAGIMFTAR